MKRSQINHELSSFLKFLEESHFKLPKWGYWTLEDWKKNIESGVVNPAECEVLKNNCGRDICDFGEPGTFAQSGLLLFTVRNGLLGSNRNYCEKIMMAKKNQVTRCHTHFTKCEDIIVRRGSPLTVELTQSSNVKNLKEGKPDPALPVTVKVDGIPRTLKGKAAGEYKIKLEEGESVTLEPGHYHAFYPEEGDCLIGEVSLVNDDENDNLFAEDLKRFPQIVEDEPPKFLLVQDYKRLTEILGLQQQKQNACC